jgi:hypothetical protein
MVNDSMYTAERRRGDYKKPNSNYTRSSYPYAPLERDGESDTLRVNATNQRTQPISDESAC